MTKTELTHDQLTPISGFPNRIDDGLFTAIHSRPGSELRTKPEKPN